MFVSSFLCLFYQKESSARPGKHLFTKHLLFSSSCELSSFLWSPRPHLLSSAPHGLVRQPWSLKFYGTHTPYKLNFLLFIFVLFCFLFVNLMMRPAKEPRKEEWIFFYAIPGVIRSMHNPFGRLWVRSLLTQNTPPDMKWILAFSKPGQRNSYYCENGVPQPVLGQLIFISDTPLLPVICCFLVFDPLIHSLTWHTFIDYLHWMCSDHRSQDTSVSKKISVLAP